MKAWKASLFFGVPVGLVFVALGAEITEWRWWVAAIVITGAHVMAPR